MIVESFLYSDYSTSEREEKMYRNDVVEWMMMKLIYEHDFVIFLPIGCDFIVEVFLFFFLVIDFFVKIEI